MTTPTDYQAEQERISKVYQNWHGGAGLPLYAWHRRDVLQTDSDRTRVFAALICATIGPDLSDKRILDVGCGSGGFLRQLISWGATPSNLTGSELQQDRLDLARVQTAQGVTWHMGWLGSLPAGTMDLVCAHTVFSSILDDKLRQQLAGEMWQMLKPGGWIMVQDFRYNNPRNPNVRKVTRAELGRLWPGRQSHYRTTLLAPPLGRAVARAPYLLQDMLALVPPLRSHFVYMVRKDA
jgi:SAM-dependent methyltransferase